MLKITQAQMDVFENIQLDRLRNDLIIHLDKYFIEEIQHIEREQLSQFVMDVIIEARSYGVEIEKQICMFLNIKVLLKIYEPFNQSPYEEIVDILNNEELGSPTARLDQLSEIVDSYLEQIAENNL